jgi:hypothetical protein
VPGRTVTKENACILVLQDGCCWTVQVKRLEGACLKALDATSRASTRRLIIDSILITVAANVFAGGVEQMFCATERKRYR